MSKLLSCHEKLVGADSLGFNAQTRLFLSNDIDAIRHEVSQVFKGHHLESSQGNLSAEMHYIQCERLAIGRLEYSQRVSIDPGCLEDFYLFHLPLCGSVNVRYGHRQFVSTTRQASFISPHEEFSMIWEANSPQLTVKINNSDMLSFIHAYFGQPIQELVNFVPDMIFDNVVGNYISQLIHLYVGMLVRDKQIINTSYLKKQCESMLVNLLINNQNSILPPAVTVKTLGVPGYLKKSRDFIHAHLSDELTIEVIALHAGVSVRTLHTGFQHHLKTSPMKYVKIQRLEGACQDLKMGDYQSVTDVALKWGFSHLGRFAQEFKKRFGFLPSEAYKVS